MRRTFCSPETIPLRRVRRPIATAVVCATVALLGGAHEIRADVTVLDHRLFGYLSQYEIGDPEAVDIDACAPTSTTNYMVYLQNKHRNSLGYELAGQTYDSWKEQAKDWIIEMGTGLLGTSPISMFDQIEITLDQCLGESSTTGSCVDPPLDPAVDKFTYAGILSWDTTFYDTPALDDICTENPGLCNRDVREGMPGPTEIKAAIDNKTPVLLGITYINGTGGHELLVNGISKHHLHFIDPLNPYVRDPQPPHQKRTKQSMGIMTVIENNNSMHLVKGRVPELKPVGLPNGTIILAYDQYQCRSPYLDRVCVNDRTGGFDCRAVPSGGCPTGSHEAFPSVRARAYVDSTFTVDFTGSPPAGGLTQVIPTPVVTPIEKRAHRKWIRCHEARNRAYEKDAVCRRKKNPQRCDGSLVELLKKVGQRHDHECGDLIECLPGNQEGRCGELIGSANQASATVSLAAAGVDIAHIGLKGKDFRCSNAFGRALAKHTRCEYAALRLERSDKDARWERYHCDHLLRKRLHSARKRYGDSCPAPTDLSTVISTNREEATPLTPKEVSVATGNLH
jgi:hypothetical protein